MPVIKGTITNPFGEPSAGATLTLTSLHNRAGILKSVFSHTTACNGSYAFSLVPGIYSVRLSFQGRSASEIGIIRVYDDSADGTLNDYLGAAEVDLRPEALKKFEALAEQARQAASDAEAARDVAEGAAGSVAQGVQEVKDIQQAVARSEAAAEEAAQRSGENNTAAQEAARVSVQASGESREAADDSANSAAAAGASQQASAGSETAAAESARQSEANNRAAQEAARTSENAAGESRSAADDSANSAADAGVSQQASAGSEAAAAEAAREAARHAQKAKGYADDSEMFSRDSRQAADDAEALLENVLKKGNHLSEIADAGTEARQEARQHLGLGAAATQGVMQDRYDRAAERLAIPGAFGFGKAFINSERVNLNASNPFVNWVRTALPGRYIVSESGSASTIPGVVFSGLVEVMPLSSHNPGTRPENMQRLILFYGVNGDLWVNRYHTAGNGYLIGWENLKLKLSDFTRSLYAAINNDWGDPDVGGLILAAYQGAADGDKNIKVQRGRSYPGSRLGPVGISASYNPAGMFTSSATFYVMGCAGHALPGTYVALSGVSSSYSDKAFIALFVRIA